MYNKNVQYHVLIGDFAYMFQMNAYVTENTVLVCPYGLTKLSG